MCGIFGVVSQDGRLDKNDLSLLVKASRQRGRDSSGLAFKAKGSKLLSVERADYDIYKLLSTVKKENLELVLGHSRLITNSHTDNQPVVKEDICVFHNGIIVNTNKVWKQVKATQNLEIDSEVLVGLTEEFLLSKSNKSKISELSEYIIARCEGVVAAAILIGRLGKLVLFSNNGSLYFGKNERGTYYASEKFPLKQIKCEDIVQVRENAIVVDIETETVIKVNDHQVSRKNLVPALGNLSQQEKKLIFEPHSLKRCAKCILPQTMPFITFDANGICNYCNNYEVRNNPKPKDLLYKSLERFRRHRGAECIVPFSGGRDSCYGLHLIVNELKLKPITYTYDWGMVTDLGRRNISRMCSNLGVENIIVAADIGLKRRNINKNLRAWLRSPHLGMVSILTAGDKHFFKHVETIKRQTGISLNLWGINPLEVTHFKSGFLGIKPDFEEKMVYSNGAIKQMRYQLLRLCAMSKSLGYFNTSIWDTLSGEYYRSFTQKSDYFHIFDYWRWDEADINKTLKLYDWEMAPDTQTTWRIGDGTAAFYNYIYYTVAGFTEHDTFRSNQIREGDISREEALRLVADENRPRYPNVKWYLDAVDIEFEEAIKVVNAMPRMY
ncbi:MAG: glucosamine 6-phosphate synthetase [Rhodospirillaceae bacterium]|nr:glucosamine 6-phosphate synthetase [Rhodospirillaceae bacterium]